MRKISLGQGRMSAVPDPFLIARNPDAAEYAFRFLGAARAELGERPESDGCGRSDPSEVVKVAHRDGTLMPWLVFE